MIKVKTKISDVRVELWMKFSFGKKIDFAELSTVAVKGCFGLLIPEYIKGSVVYYTPFRGKRLKDILSSGLSRDGVIRIIEQILLVMMEIEEIGLSKASVMLELNNLYMDTDANEIRMLCSTAASEGKNHSITKLIYEILDTYTTTETVNLDFRRRFFDYLDHLGMDDIFRIEDFLVNEKKRVVLDVRDTYYTRLYTRLSFDQKTLVKVNSIRRDIDTEKLKIASEEENEPTDYMNDDDEPTGFIDDDETDFSKSDGDAYEKTGLFKDTDDRDVEDRSVVETRKTIPKKIVEKPRLIRVSKSETIFINKTSFRLGREEGGVDYCISDNKKISRAHVDLVSRGGKWYVVDLKSKNRTFLNDKVLQANIETPLNDGDIIKLNTEEFVFCLSVDG